MKMRSISFLSLCFLLMVGLSGQVGAFLEGDLKTLKVTGNCVRCYLSGADLVGIDLNSSDLRYTDLPNANLFGADLTGATLSTEFLTGVDLRGVNLDNAILIDRQIGDYPRIVSDWIESKLGVPPSVAGSVLLPIIIVLLVLVLPTKRRIVSSWNNNATGDFGRNVNAIFSLEEHHRVRMKIGDESFLLPDDLEGIEFGVREETTKTRKKRSFLGSVVSFGLKVGAGSMATKYHGGSAAGLFMASQGLDRMLERSSQKIKVRTEIKYTVIFQFTDGRVLGLTMGEKQGEDLARWQSKWNRELLIEELVSNPEKTKDEFSKLNLEPYRIEFSENVKNIEKMRSVIGNLSITEKEKSLEKISALNEKNRAIEEHISMSEEYLASCIEEAGARNGEVKDDNHHAPGTETTSDGSKYVGELKDNKANGQGTFIDADGTKYVGGWKDGNPHGQGTSTTSDGTKYVGEYKDGKCHGQGTETTSDGRKYVGEYKDHESWNGTVYDKDGNVTGTWSEGVWKGK